MVSCRLHTGHTGKGEGLLIGTTNAPSALIWADYSAGDFYFPGEFESDMAFILPPVFWCWWRWRSPPTLGVHAGIRALGKT